MVERTEKRDIVNTTKFAFIGHDTGLLKKLKLSIRREETAHIVTYGHSNRTIVKRRKLEDGEEEKVTVKRGRGALTEEDNQKRIRF